MAQNLSLVGISQTSIDFIQTEKLSSSVKKTNTAFFSYFDRRWWRENDIFIKASDTLDSNALAEPYYSPYDLVRVGNGKDNFGILRTFYVAGIEQSYKVDHELFGYSSILETGMRGYWERFIDDRKTGFTADSVFTSLKFPNKNLNLHQYRCGRVVDLAAFQYKLRNVPSHPNVEKEA